MSGRPPPRILAVAAATAAILALLAAAATGLVAWRDRQVVARYAGAALEPHLAAPCRNPPWEQWDRIAAESVLVHAEDDGAPSAGRRALRIYRHRHLHYYVDTWTGVLPTTRRLCEAD